MLTEDELNTYLPEDGYEATSLGSPAEILEYKNNVILVYDHNIATANFTRYHLRSMHLTRPEKRREDGTILLEYDDIMYGPYIHLGSGDYVLTIEAETEVEAELRITSYTTSGPIGEYTLSNGVNTFAFSLQDGAENIEFFLHNTSDSPIVIQNITLTQIN